MPSAQRAPIGGERVGVEAGIHVAAGDHQAHVGAIDRGEGAQQRLGPLPRRELREVQDDWRVAQAMRGAEALAIGRRLELALVDRIRAARVTRSSATPSVDQLTALGLADRDDLGCAFEVAAAGGGVEQPLGEQPAAR